MTQIKDIEQSAQKYGADMFKFLRDLIRIPGEGQQEGQVVDRIREEMERLDFDRVCIDSMGNVLGYMGEGKELIAFDGHVDTVGTGALEDWSFDPHEGFEDDIWIGGRGASDQRSGIVSAVYGAKIMKELGLIAPEQQILVVGSVQEEECEGLNWQHLIEKENVSPSYVILTEPTDGNVYRGHRGRMDIIVQVKGRSAHGSTPEKGVNAICRMAKIVNELEELNDRLPNDPFLGKGSLAITQIFYTSASRCAIADGCSISIDRRLTAGETEQSALELIRELPSIKRYRAEVYTDTYERTSWKGLVCKTACYFPAWQLPEDHRLCEAAMRAAMQTVTAPKLDKWLFSTNGVSIMGKYHIPCIGYGPGLEGQAHAPNEKMPKSDLIRCAATYALIPAMLKQS